ncbi:Tat pathway signal sequence domain protein [Mycolicibacterium septicum DSM 44393]|uniref:Tat pathway signal sequence domain protein n=1 Tax=Mycolicibacterium septicum DSM 44393 TaxID=1341646 RepID=A0A7X6MP06_9MYCO|nr:Tat pathway signal sequence domain protein [Mycolicibacterium septicum]NKZ11283.1 Tat pathway signal sequence domain protein [Mycolicibacterium septicum DSM 44393]
MRIVSDCLDPQFATAVIDAEDDLTEPIVHRRVKGHFEGTKVRFAVYLPTRDHWHGRFFQNVYPLEDEQITERNLRFAEASGGYAVQTNASAGYRGDAAAARFSRTIAGSYYGTDAPIHGYIWGGSGGSYQTIAAMENTDGVWAGGVPFIVGDPTSIPNNFFIRSYARLLLRDKAAQIADAVAPGGDGNPYDGLDEAERAAFHEVTSLGVPLRAWEDSRYVLGLDAPDGLLGFASMIKHMDPGFSNDFWTQPGYLGTENSALGKRIRDARIDQTVTITGVDTREGRTLMSVDGIVDRGYQGGVDVSPAGAGEADAVMGQWDPLARTLIVGQDTPEATRVALHVGARVHLNNSWYVALTSYPRHQLPAASAGFAPYDQYRNPDGSARYPQRPLLAGATISQQVSEGGAHTGAIHGKVIAVSNLLDTDAFPWHGDWYAHQVRSALGDNYDDNFRLWYSDDADHIAPQRTPRLIDYTGVIERALLDVAAWAEDGVAPPGSSRYTVTDGQVHPSSADERGGVQPIVDLTVKGDRRAMAHVGEQVRFDATVTLPPEAGVITEAAWDATGDGHFAPIDTAVDRQHLLTHTASYSTPGTYYPAVRIRLHRNDAPQSAFTGVDGLGRMRVVVVP